MKNLLVLLFTTFSISTFCQITSKENLDTEFLKEFNAKHNEEAFLILQLTESNYGVTNETRYLKSLLCYYSLKERIEYEKTSLIFETMKMFDSLINENKLSEKKINNLKYFKVVISFSLIYDSNHKRSLGSKVRKEVADNIIKEANFLISPYVLDIAKKSDIERVLKKTTENYDFYIGEIKALRK